MNGYIAYPALSEEHLAFICEDALWVAPRRPGTAEVGTPRRLTAGTELVRNPCFSPEGHRIAFDSDFEGVPQVYSISVDGGAAERLTFDATPCSTVGFRPSGKLLLRANDQAPMRHFTTIDEMDLWGGGRQRLPIGRAMTAAFAEDDDEVVIGLRQVDNARWKRYRGGTAGDLWIGSLSRGEFRRLVETGGNPVRPFFHGDRVYFLDDAGGFGNLWSCLRDGSDLREHTHHRDFYARHSSPRGHEVVYMKGGEVLLFDLNTGEEQALEIDTRPSALHRQRKFISAGGRIRDVDLSGDGRSIAGTVRGKYFSMRAWGGPVQWPGSPSGVRYRDPRWFDAGEQVVVISDEDGEERLEVYTGRMGVRRKTVALGSISRVTGLFPHPRRPIAAVTDISGGLTLVDLEGEKEPELVGRSTSGTVQDVTWSADGRWLAYVLPEHWLIAGGVLHLHDREEGTTHRLNPEELPVHSPTFDPDGRFLFVLSERTFNPSLDSVHFAASCQESTRIYTYVLSGSEMSPFDARWPDRLEDIEKEREKQKKEEAAASAEDDDADHGDDPDTDDPERNDERGERDGADDAGDEGEGPDAGEDAGESSDEDAPTPVHIDLDGLEERVVLLPEVEPGIYSNMQAASHRLLFLTHPRLGLLDSEEESDDHLPDLLCHDLKTGKRNVICEAVKDYLVRGEKTMIVTAEGLRVLKTGEELPDDAPAGHNPTSGSIDLDRLRVEVVPSEEWRQMFLEAWRMQRDRFWTADMAGVDWEAVRDRYLPLLDRISTRAELSDLIWEMQGELGTSHAYEWGGDYPEGTSYAVGCLGADLTWDGQGYRIDRILRGDSWVPGSSSPLAAPGVEVKEGDRILAIGGEPLLESFPPARLLVHQAGVDVELTIQAEGKGDDETHWVVVHTLGSERALRYRDWVRRNRERALAESGGQLGYLHIPDMGGAGLSEFFRAFRAESKRPGLLVDLRGNGGGFVSPLIVDYLRRKVIGFDRPRYGRWETYPPDCVRGPIVGIVDEFAGSDGDMISHAFRVYEIGPLIGKRTWGGVIGINVDDELADGTVVTQPEYAAYFPGKGWGIENRGVDPDIVVEHDPASAAAGQDPQLARAIAVALEKLEQDPVRDPEWADVPSRRVD